MRPVPVILNRFATDLRVLAFPPERAIAAVKVAGICEGASQFFKDICHPEDRVHAVNFGGRPALMAPL